MNLFILKSSAGYFKFLILFRYQLDEESQPSCYKLCSKSDDKVTMQSVSDRVKLEIFKHFYFLGRHNS